MSRSWWESPYEQPKPKARERWFAGRLRHGPIVLFAAVLALIVAAVGWLAFTKDPNEPRLLYANTWSHPATTEAALQQCGDTFTFDIQPYQYGVVPKGYEGKTVPRHEHIVPAYGYMTGWVKDSKQFYAPDDKDLPNSPEMMRWMYEGKKIIWYPNSNNEETFEMLQEFTDEHEDFIALPWRVEYGGVNEQGQERALPEGRNIGLSAWGVTKSCGLWSPMVGEEFSSFVEEHQNMDATPQQTVELLKNGELPLIVNE